MSANFTPNQNEYKNLTPFKCWLLNQINNWGLANFPFVESDFDELTNYGMLMKMMKALNDVISNQNEVEQDMTNLFGAFTELQTYVNDYFDNLDVQDEINNKLDDMVDSGELQEIITSYLNSKALFGFDNVQSMKQSTNLINGSYAKTMGYHTKNDGGSALYKIREITNDDVVDESLIVAMNNNDLVAELITDGTIKVEQLGAYGDGIHDDTSAIQKALNNFNDVLMNKTYLISEIEIKKNLTSHGTINGNVKIKTSNVNFDFNLINGELIIESSSTYVQGVNVNGHKITNENGNGLTLFCNGYGILYCKFKVDLIRADKCINFDYGNGGYINQNYFYKTNVSYHTGIYTDPNNASYYNGNVFSEMGFEDITTWFTLNKMEATLFENCRMLPFEADGSSDIHELGTINNSRTVYFDNPTHGLYYEFITTNSRCYALDNCKTYDGTNIGKYVSFKSNEIINIDNSLYPQFYKNIGDLSSPTQVNVYEYDLHKPLIFNANANKYIYLVINYQNTPIKTSFKYVDITIVGTLQNSLTVVARTKDNGQTSNVTLGELNSNSGTDFTKRYYF